MKSKYRKNSHKTKLLNDFFRNALAIAILKQSLISGVSTLKSGSSGTKDSVPTYLQG
jgi:hypothetical protein|tara:strand:+ start:320 stop:490 length:171 start_codon:yes stop_codon:yes gene_type:complete